jgi:tetratricopeptide (TPR) repeat protein
LKKKFYGIAIVLPLFLVLSCGPSPKDMVMAGDQKKNAHDFTGALADYSAAITAKPAFYQAWHNRGECQMNLGAYDLAVKDFDESLQLKPGFALSLYDKGLCFLKLKKYPEALQCIEKATQADTAIHGNAALANCYFYSGKNQLAAHYFSASLAEMPDSVGFYLGRALAYYQLGNIAASKSDLEIYLKSGGVNPVVLRQLGLVYLRSGTEAALLDSSIIFFEQYKGKGIVLDTEAAKALALAYLERGKLKMEIDKEIEAMADFSKVIELEPANAEAYYQRGKIMVSLGQTADGCLDLQNALKNGNADAKKLISIYCGEVL